ncbi:type I-E CRISPR-associated protein Cas6/Cse3/CasE [Thioclava sp. GXIMD4215]|uniref:type I-E CRISPR-associated protein Cas6/Cse3/CasE n=1 Tax=Thioclava sp. GXIMD4215 TaxID=3131928 RepID=UPI00311B0E92
MMYLSRLRLSRDPQTLALDALLTPGEGGERLDAHHRLIWTLFADDPQATRDFLWCEDGPRGFLVQSARPPQASPLFDPPEIRTHAPDLRPSDQLEFSLRVNATKTLRRPGERGTRVDVVMNLLHGLPKHERNARRMDLAQVAGAEWLAGQGEKAGFTVDRVEVRDYSTQTLPGYRGRRKGEPRFGILDLGGQITVTDPALFLPRLKQGFGRAKSFGCGLMLIRRA